MLEFDTLCYLQNHKTGCTFVERFLREFCCEDIWRYEKHSLPRVHKPDKFYFVNVREPLDAYLSLFNFGLDGHGELLLRLRAVGKADLYARGMDGFASWLEAVLDSRNASLMYPASAVPLAPHLGLLSWRYLRLAALGLDSAASQLAGAEDISAFALQHKRVDVTVRYESLREDLQALFSGRLRYVLRDPERALDWLSRAPKVNASNRRDRLAEADLPEALAAQLREREWYLYSNFYPDRLVNNGQ